MTALLWPEMKNTIEHEFTPTISPYLVDRNDKHAAVIICPGGGYGHRAHHEGEPVAKWLNSFGISAFVLNYRVSPSKHPSPLADCQRAIRYVRYHANEWNLDKEKIGILGFSAGGHLAASASTLDHINFYDAIDQIDQESSRPDLAILCYPVISFIKHYHQGSMHNLLGEDPTDELRALMSLEQNVSKSTPPTFLWHTADDAAVPVENSLLYALALREQEIPLELHIFPHGRHGLGLAGQDDNVSEWTELCKRWLVKQGF
ncbi:alpha/beta hydrolase [Litchfieldia salsa]|uniref:Acetyl esterase/lipase n=1 Tax=Litchfieldia salsa TaxID=930152 RepID=A0A1H0VXN2_9BACI|nr:alpha/beta hydrolase [Litchfieldia salsa]SDP83277.1 Acetyl esterase/lipase [Litchfieldia salsa]